MQLLPLLPILKKQAREVTVAEIEQVAESFAGPNFGVVSQILQSIREVEPLTPVNKLLGSDTAAKLLTSALTKAQEARAELDKGIVFKCPHCDEVSYFEAK